MASMVWTRDSPLCGRTTFLGLVFLRVAKTDDVGEAEAECEAFVVSRGGRGMFRSVDWE
jgi:hypothetical protein